MFTRQQRTDKIAILEKEFGEARGLFLTDINKISVNKISQLRSDFRKNGMSYIVVKNSLARIAAQRTGKDTIVPFFKGQVGVVIAKKEPTAPAKIIREFRKTNKDLLPVKAAYVEGSVFDQAKADRLADIPSREVLLAQLLGCLQAPIANLAGALNGILGKLVGTLDAVKTKKESNA